MSNIKKITVGIPAYNEERNIRKCINSILNSLQNMQKKVPFEIFIADDRSTDRTKEELGDLLMQNYQIQYLRNETRSGKNFSMNRIKNISSGDIIVFIDADTIVENTYFQIIYDIWVNESPILASTETYPLYRDSLVGKTIFVGDLFKREIIKHKGLNNFYDCVGRSLILDKKLKNIPIPLFVMDDSYLYLYCKENSLKFLKIQNTGIFFKLSNSLHDFMIQGSRFHFTKRKPHVFFRKHLLLKETSIPLFSSIKISLIFFAKYPLYFFFYIILFAFSRIILIPNQVGETYDPSQSTK